MKKLLYTIVTLLIGLGVSHGYDLSFPAGLTGTFPGIDQNYSLVDFHIQNGFGGVFLWRDNKTLSVGQDLVVGSDTIDGCMQQLQGFYYNNQRGFRLWPLDQNSLTGMQSIDSSYNALSLTGGLYTDCDGVDSNNVYGALGHIRGGHTYWLLGGVEFDFTNKIWVDSFSGSFVKDGNGAIGRVFDSQGAIGEFVGDLRRDLCPDGDFSGSYYDGECGTPPPVCGNNIVETGEECDGSSNCKSDCTRKSSGGGGGGISMDYCPDGDFSGSYYDGKCGTPPEHGAPIVELVGKACIYDDADYLANGPFTDTTNHRGYPYTEIMRVSCMHRGRGIGQGLWIYEPNSGITRAEILKTIVKILGVEFEDFSIQTEDAVYPFSVQFADVPQDHWFAWYANYALNKGLVSGMAEMRNGQRYLNPDQPATRYEAIQAMMTAYNLINDEKVDFSSPSVLGDVVDPNNPYYQSVRQAEALGFISGVPQTNGSYNFEGIRNITRAEFAKIVSVPFSEQLFDIDEVVLNSQLYKIVVQAINEATGDKFVFINTLVEKLQAIDDYTFIMDFKIQKELFLDKLEELLIRPLVEQELMEND